MPILQFYVKLEVEKLPGHKTYSPSETRIACRKKTQSAVQSPAV